MFLFLYDLFGLLMVSMGGVVLFVVVVVVAVVGVIAVFTNEALAVSASAGSTSLIAGSLFWCMASTIFEIKNPV